MVAKKKETLRNFDYATWELQWDHRSPPVLRVNFSKRPEGLPPHDPKDDPTTADRTLAFKRFLNNNKIDLYGAGENTEFYPREGVARITGKKNIDKLAAWLHYHNDETGKNDKYLALIPPSVSRNYGKGEENYPEAAKEVAARETATVKTVPFITGKKAEGEFALDGEPPAAKPTRQMSPAQKHAMNERLGKKPTLEEQRAEALRNATSPEAIDIINQSFERRLRMHEGEAPADVKQPELAPVPETSWAERVKGDALRLPLEPIADAPYKHAEIAAAAVEAITVAGKKLPTSDALREHVGMKPAQDPVQLPLTGDDLLRERIQMIERKRTTSKRTRKPKEDKLSGDFFVDMVKSAPDDKTPGKTR